jgi:hypothetical protein
MVTRSRPSVEDGHAERSLLAAVAGVAGAGADVQSALEAASACAAEHLNGSLWRPLALLLLAEALALRAARASCAADIADAKRTLLELRALVAASPPASRAGHLAAAVFRLACHRFFARCARTPATSAAEAARAADSHLEHAATALSEALGKDAEAACDTAAAVDAAVLRAAVWAVRRFALESGEATAPRARARILREAAELAYSCRHKDGGPLWPASAWATASAELAGRALEFLRSALTVLPPAELADELRNCLSTALRALVDPLERPIAERWARMAHMVGASLAHQDKFAPASVFLWLALGLFLRCKPSADCFRAAKPEQRLKYLLVCLRRCGGPSAVAEACALVFKWVAAHAAARADAAPDATEKAAADAFAALSRDIAPEYVAAVTELDAKKADPPLADILADLRNYPSLLPIGLNACNDHDKSLSVAIPLGRRLRSGDRARDRTLLSPLLILEAAAAKSLPGSGISDFLVNCYSALEEINSDATDERGVALARLAHIQVTGARPDTHPDVALPDDGLGESSFSRSETAMSMLECALLFYQRGYVDRFVKTAIKAVANLRALKEELHLHEARSMLDVYGVVQQCIDAALLVDRADLASKAIKAGIGLAIKHTGQASLEIAQSAVAALLAQSGYLDVHRLGKWTKGVKCMKRVIEQLQGSGVANNSHAMLLQMHALETLLATLTPLRSPGMADFWPMAAAAILGKRNTATLQGDLIDIATAAHGLLTGTVAACLQSTSLSCFGKVYASCVNLELRSLDAQVAGNAAAALMLSERRFLCAQELLRKRPTPWDLAVLSGMRLIFLEVDSVLALGCWWNLAGAAGECMEYLGRAVEIALEVDLSPALKHACTMQYGLACVRAGQVIKARRALESATAVGAERRFLDVERRLLDVERSFLDAACSPQTTQWEKCLKVMEAVAERTIHQDQPVVILFCGSVLPLQSVRNEVIARSVLAEAREKKKIDKDDRLAEPLAEGHANAALALLADVRSSDPGSSRIQEVITRHYLGLRDLYDQTMQLAGHGSLRTTALSIEALLRNVDPQVASDAALHSLGISARHRMNMRALKMLDDGVVEAAACFRFRKAESLAALGVLPAGWTVLSVTVQADGRRLTLERLERGYERPLLVEVQCDMLALLQRFDTIMEKNTGTLSELRTSSIVNARYEDKNRLNREWWRERTELDEALRVLLVDLENVVLSKHSAMLLPARADRDLNWDAAAAAAWWRSAVPGAAAAPTADVARYLRNVAQRLGRSNQQAAAAAAREVLGAEVSLNAVLEWISRDSRGGGGGGAVSSDGNDDGMDDGALILVLDSRVQALPWESMPLLRGHAVYRLPSVAFVEQRARRLLDDASAAATATVDVRKAQFVLNPSNDLNATQQRYETSGRFQAWARKLAWSGASGRQPVVEEYRGMLENSGLFLYVGHSSGEQYFRVSQMDLLKKCATVMLMGCGSGSLKISGEYDAHGVVLHYLFAGAPAAVANLWSVTDGDIDLLSLDLLERFVDGATRPSLARAVAAARERCKLRYLNGSATVVYGTPVRRSRS